MGFTTNNIVNWGYGHAAPEHYKYDKFLWVVSNEVVNRGLRGNRSEIKIHGPYCAREGCRADLALSGNLDEAPANYACLLCGKKYTYKASHLDLKRLVLLSFQSKSRETWPVIALDQPPADLQARDKDNEHWIAARIGTKNAKRVGVVYFGKTKKDQTKEDYAHLFIDFDDEQIRHDPSNMNPMEIIAKVEVEFKNSTTKKADTKLIK